MKASRKAMSIRSFGGIDQSRPPKEIREGVEVWFDGIREYPMKDLRRHPDWYTKSLRRIYNMYDGRSNRGMMLFTMLGAAVVAACFHNRVTDWMTPIETPISRQENQVPPARATPSSTLFAREAMK